MLAQPHWLMAIRRAPRDHQNSAALPIYRVLRWLAVVTTVGMLLVLLQGTLVTNSGSEAGCGNTWPLCHGQVIPEFQGIGGAATTIEFSHRAAVPVESTLILLLAAGVFWFWPGRREVQVLAPAMIVFLLLQAVLGGLAVMFPTSAEVLAAHFGISLVAFATVLLTASFVLEANGAEEIRDQPLNSRLRVFIWITLTFTYLVVYLGAYVRHAGASLACADWPLCRGQLVPTLDHYVGAQLLHRGGALLLMLLTIGLFMIARNSRSSRPDLYWGSAIALVLVLLQALSGGIVVLSQLAILSTLLHSLLVTLMFGTLCYMALHSMRRPAKTRVAMQTSRERGTLNARSLRV